MNEQARWGLIVAFPDDSPSFTNGYEAGQIGRRMQCAEPSIETTLHTENAEVISNMALHYGYTVDIKPTDVAGWSECKLTKARPAGALHVVS